MKQSPYERLSDACLRLRRECLKELKGLIVWLLFCCAVVLAIGLVLLIFCPKILIGGSQ